MLLTVDIKNTCISFGFFKIPQPSAKIKQNLATPDLVKPDSVELEFSVSIYADREKSADEYAAVIENVLAINIKRNTGYSPYNASNHPGNIRQLFPGAACTLDNVSAIMLSSAAPSLTGVITEALTKLTHAKIVTVGPGIKTMLDIKIDNPAQLASDIVANSVAADFLFKKSAVIIIDIGFATSVSVLLKNQPPKNPAAAPRGCFIGCVIAPGVLTAHKSLIETAELITNVQLTPPPAFIGKNTDDAVRSGAIFGNALFVDSCIARIAEETGFETDNIDEKIDIIAAGEFPELIVPYCRTNVKIDKYLTHKGLYLLYLYNKKYLKM